MSDDSKIDKLVDALQRLVDGAPVRRYWVEFIDRLTGTRRTRVVEAFSHDDAVKAAQIRAHMRGHEPSFVRPALDTDCWGCGSPRGLADDGYCKDCGLSRARQIDHMRGTDGLR